MPTNGSSDTGLFFSSTALAFICYFTFFTGTLLTSDFEKERKRMVDEDLRGRGIHDNAVLSAMLKVPRHLFVGGMHVDHAYADSALPIKENQTISQPYIVALMTQNAMLRPTDRVLEIGSGSGYQAAVLAEIVSKVFTIEIIKNLAETAKERLHRLGYKNIEVIHGDGYQGWASESPFDVIIITAAAPKIPEPLIAQLKIGGRLIMPFGQEVFSQDLMRYTKEANGLKKEYITGVRFVPMTGEVRK